MAGPPNEAWDYSMLPESIALAQNTMAEYQIKLHIIPTNMVMPKRTKQNKTKQNKTKQKQNKTKQNKTKQNKTKQNKTKQTMISLIISRFPMT
jgi:hypothetical protein